MLQRWIFGLRSPLRGGGGPMSGAVRNRAQGTTGVSLNKHPVFVQVLAGPAATLADAIASIRRDRRHRSPVVLSKYATKKRIFPSWQTGFDHMNSIESRVGSGLPGNHGHSIPTLAARHAAEDPIANILSHFMRSSARDLIFDPAIHEP